MAVGTGRRDGQTRVLEVGLHPSVTGCVHVKKTEEMNTTLRSILGPQSGAFTCNGTS